MTIRGGRGGGGHIARKEKGLPVSLSLSLSLSPSLSLSKIAPVIACTLPALTDSIPERKRGELAGEGDE